jgi:hypothetical protein
MAACNVCHKPITKVQARSAVTMKNDAGKTTGMRHGKCNRVRTRREDHAEQAAAGNPVAGHGAPNAYAAAEQFGNDRRITDEEVIAARARQQLIAEERQAGMDERRTDDWREQTTDDTRTLDEIKSSGETLDLDQL